LNITLELVGIFVVQLVRTYAKNNKKYNNIQNYSLTPDEELNI